MAPVCVAQRALFRGGDGHAIDRVNRSAHDTQPACRRARRPRHHDVADPQRRIERPAESRTDHSVHVLLSFNASTTSARPVHWPPSTSDLPANRASPANFAPGQASLRRFPEALSNPIELTPFGRYQQPGPHNIRSPETTPRRAAALPPPVRANIPIRARPCHAAPTSSSAPSARHRAAPAAPCPSPPPSRRGHSRRIRHRIRNPHLGRRPPDHFRQLPENLLERQVLRAQNIALAHRPRSHASKMSRGHIAHIDHVQAGIQDTPASLPAQNPPRSCPSAWA